MPWYEGPSLLYHLEHVHVASDRNLQRRALPGAVGHPPDVRRAPRLPRLRGRRSPAGVLPPGRRGRRAAVRAAPARIAAIDTFDGALDEAVPAAVGDAAARGRHRRLARRHDLPRRRTGRRRGAGHRRDGLLDGRRARCRRRAATASSTRRRTALRQGRRRSSYRIDVEHAAPRRAARTRSAQRDRPRPAAHCRAPLLVDEYRRNRATGSFILIDEATNDTVGAGWSSPRAADTRPRRSSRGRGEVARRRDGRCCAARGSRARRRCSRLDRRSSRVPLRSGRSCPRSPVRAQRVRDALVAPDEAAVAPAGAGPSATLGRSGRRRRARCRRAARPATTRTERGARAAGDSVVSAAASDSRPAALEVRLERGRGRAARPVPARCRSSSGCRRRARRHRSAPRRLARRRRRLAAVLPRADGVRPRARRRRRLARADPLPARRPTSTRGCSAARAPTVWLQQHLHEPGRGSWFEVAAFLVYVSHFFVDAAAGGGPVACATAGASAASPASLALLTLLGCVDVRRVPGGAAVDGERARADPADARG